MTVNADKLLCYQLNTTLEKLIQVIIQKVAPNFTDAQEVKFFARPTFGATDSDPNTDVVDLIDSVTNRLVAATVGLKIVPGDIDLSAEVGRYAWDVFVRRVGTVLSALKTDGDASAVDTFDSASATFITEGVVAGSFLIVTAGVNAGVYKVLTTPTLETRLLTDPAFKTFPETATTNAMSASFRVEAPGKTVYFPKGSAPLTIQGGGS